MTASPNLGIANGQVSQCVTEGSERKLIRCHRKQARGTRILAQLTCLRLRQRRLFEYLGSLICERSNSSPDPSCLLIRRLYTGIFESSLVMKTLRLSYMENVRQAGREIS